MDCVLKMSDLIDSMENLHQRRTSLLKRYLDIIRKNGDLHKIQEQLLFAEKTKEGCDVDTNTVPSIVSNVLQDMKRDLKLLGSLRELLTTLNQINQLMPRAHQGDGDHVVWSDPTYIRCSFTCSENGEDYMRGI